MALTFSSNVNFGGGLRIGNPVFGPAALFSAGEIGVWYDPSDFSTMFQDTAGTTPVTAVEQPVGLILDKSQGLVLGSELTTNGSFDTNTAWTKSAGITISGGQCVLTAAAAISSALYQSAAVSVGKWYRYEIVVSSFSSGNIQPRLFGMASHFGAILGAGTYVYYGSPTSANTNVGFGLGATTTATIDSISVKELPGNHAVAANNGAARPILRNRYNLFQYSEALDNAYWRQQECTLAVTLDTTDPLGGSGAYKYTKNNANPDYLNSASAITVVGASNHTISVYAKRGDQDWLRIAGFTSAAGAVHFNAWFDLNTGTVGSTTTASGGSVVGSSIVSVGNGWYRCTVTGATASGTTTLYPTFSMVTADGATTRPAAASFVYLWGAQVTTAADNTAINGEYQRIAAATDYNSDLTKFPVYLYATTDDSMSTAAIDFSVGDEMSVFAGVTKESDAATGVIYELSADSGLNNGTFFGDSESGIYQVRSKGTAQASTGSAITPYSAPSTNVLSHLCKIITDTLKARVNGVEISSIASDQGTGNYGNYPLYLFARNNSSFFYTGRLYSLIVRNKLTTGTDLTNTEAWVADKTGVVI